MKELDASVQKTGPVPTKKQVMESVKKMRRRQAIIKKDKRVCIQSTDLSI